MDTSHPNPFAPEHADRFMAYNESVAAAMHALGALEDLRIYVQTGILSADFVSTFSLVVCTIGEMTQKSPAEVAHWVHQLTKGKNE